MSLVHLEVMLGGTLTGSLIGLLWNPAAALVALIAAAAMALIAGEWSHYGPTR